MPRQNPRATQESHKSPVRARYKGARVQLYRDERQGYDAESCPYSESERDTPVTTPVTSVQQLFDLNMPLGFSGLSASAGNSNWRLVDSPDRPSCVPPDGDVPVHQAETGTRYVRTPDTR